MEGSIYAIANAAVIASGYSSFANRMLYNCRSASDSPESFRGYGEFPSLAWNGRPLCHSQCSQHDFHRE